MSTTSLSTQATAQLTELVTDDAQHPAYQKVLEASLRDLNDRMGKEGVWDAINAVRVSARALALQLLEEAPKTPALQNDSLASSRTLFDNAAAKINAAAEAADAKDDALAKQAIAALARCQNTISAIEIFNANGDPAPLKKTREELLDIGPSRVGWAIGGRATAAPN